MTSVSLSFYNYSISSITLTTPGGQSIPIAPDGKVDDASSIGDYVIEYDSKKFKFTRNDINQLAAHSYYDVFITDSIVLGNPVSESTYTHGTVVNKISNRSATTWSVFISPDQDITITNGSSDGSWIILNQPSNTNLIILIILVLFSVIVFLIAMLAIYMYSKKRRT